MYNDILGETPKKKTATPPLPPPMKVQAGAAKIPHKKRTHPTLKGISKVLVKDFGLGEDNAKVPDCDCEDGSCDDCGQEAELDDELEELELEEFDFEEDDCCEDGGACGDCEAGDGKKSCAASGITITSTKLIPKQLKEIDPWHIEAGYKRGKLKIIGLITDNIKLGLNSRKEDI